MKGETGVNQVNIRKVYKMQEQKDDTDEGCLLFSGARLKNCSIWTRQLRGESDTRQILVTAPLTVLTGLAGLRLKCLFFFV